MAAGELADDKIARSLAAKAYAAEVTAVEMGWPVDHDVVREGLLTVWESAGHPAGAFLRAALLIVDLPDRIAEAVDGAPNEFTISREQDVEAAQRARAFLEQLALELG